MSVPLLFIKRVNKFFGGVHALTDVDFILDQGEVHSIIGPNGSGKSTLVNIIAGVFEPTNGHILLKGKEVQFSSPQDAMRNKIVMIHQELRLISELSVAENIFFGRQPVKKTGMIDWKKMNSMAQEILENLKCDIDVNNTVSMLSVADQQMVEMAKALSQQAEILIMDEPTASLTQEETDVLFKTVRDLKNQGITIVFISHRLNEVLEISDRITVLQDSYIISTINNNESVTKDLLISLMIKKNAGIFNARKAQDFSGSEIILEINNLNYKNKISNISFKLHKGEILGFAGLVGSGRTELLKCIFGVYQDWTGEILVDGENFHAKSPIEAVRKGIAYVPEDRKSEGLVLGMSIFDNMIFASLDQYSKANIINKKKATRDIEQKSQEMNLKFDTFEAVASSLSGGNQQKIVLGKWMLANSDIILLDEPTRGIDVGAKNEVYKLADTLASLGKAIIFISSEIEEVLIVCDRILTIKDGMITAELRNNELNIEEVMGYATK